LRYAKRVKKRLLFSGGGPSERSELSSDEDFLSDLLPKVCLEVASLATDIYVVMLMALQGSRFFLLKLRDPFKQTTQKQHLFILLSHNENSQ